MRGPFPFTEAERELIGAYTSGLNGCRHCYRGRVLTAVAFGIPEALFETLLDDLDAAAVDEWMKPVLRYVGKLATSPAKLIADDAQAVIEAGWDERALFHAVAVCAYFNFINRIVDGMGLMATEEQLQGAARHLHDFGYGDGSIKNDARK